MRRKARWWAGWKAAGVWLGSTVLVTLLIDTVPVLAALVVVLLAAWVVGKLW